MTAKSFLLILKPNFGFLDADFAPQLPQKALETSEPQFAQYAN